MALYAFTGDGRCRSCDAPILWWRTPTGRNIPIDDRREVLGGRMLQRGDVCTSEEAVDGLLPFTHFKTCPYANEHRRSR